MKYPLLKLTAVWKILLDLLLSKGLGVLLQVLYGETYPLWMARSKSCVPLKLKIIKVCPTLRVGVYKCVYLQVNTEHVEVTFHFENLPHQLSVFL